MIVHHDHVIGLAPLIPWLHSSEACEHVFGEAHQVVKDFTLLDFIYMVPKLHIRLRQAILCALASDPKAHASGYCHTYFDYTGINLQALVMYPSDNEINEAAWIATEEADSLVALLGIVPGQLHHLQSASAVVLPSILSLLWETDADNDDTLSVADSNVGSTKSISDAQELQKLLDHEEDVNILQT